MRLASEEDELGLDDPVHLMMKVQASAGNKALPTTTIVPDVTIFFCLTPPTPNIEHPHASRNLRGWAVALLANKYVLPLLRVQPQINDFSIFRRWFDHLILLNNMISCFVIGVDTPIADE